MPLSRKILLGLLPLFLIFISISVALQNDLQEREMMEEAQSSARNTADILRESLVSMMLKNYEVDTSFIQRVTALRQIDTLRLFVNDLRLRPGENEIVVLALQFDEMQSALKEKIGQPDSRRPQRSEILSPHGHQR